MDLSLIVPAFIAGVLTFLAPCTLPLVPAYLGFISGVSAKDLADPQKAKSARLKIFLNGLFFVLGFSAVFIILGTAAGLFGQTFFQYRIWLSRIGGIFVILFGLFMLHPVRNPLRLWRGGSRLKRFISNGVNIIKIPVLTREAQFKAPTIFKNARAVNSFILGATFGFGWTPCVGPILGSILALAAASTTVGQGAFLLAIFSLGLALPFLAIAIGIGSASAYIEKLGKYLGVISTIGGLFLIFLGILIFTEKFALWISFFYRFFDFIDYGRLVDYL